MQRFGAPTPSRKAIQTLSPVRRESWAETAADRGLEHISRLGIDHETYKYVGQGSLLDFSPAGFIEMYHGKHMRSSDTQPTHIGSEGFGRCSLLLISVSEGQRHIFAHVEPNADDFWYNMDGEPMKGRGWESARAVIGYGHVSSRQGWLEETLLQGDVYGPTEISRIEVDTGGAHWHALFTVSTGELAIVRKTPDQVIFYYQPFAKAEADAKR